MPQFASQIRVTDQQEESEMSKVVRFRRLKHGDPPRFKVLLDQPRRPADHRGYRVSVGAFPIMILVLIGVAAALVVGGFVA